MLKNKKLKIVQDQHRIDVDDPTEVDRVQSMFPELETIDVVEAIQQFGPIRGKVLEYLKNTYRALQDSFRVPNLRPAHSTIK